MKWKLLGPVSSRGRWIFPIAMIFFSKYDMKIQLSDAARRHMTKPMKGTKNSRDFLPAEVNGNMIGKLDYSL